LSSQNQRVAPVDLAELDHPPFSLNFDEVSLEVRALVVKITLRRHNVFAVTFLVDDEAEIDFSHWTLAPAAVE